MTTTIYILKLINDKYYIGKTDRMENRYQQHIEGDGSFWTKKYKPLSIIKQIDNSSPFDEDIYVKEYMSMYGIENVRGGSYNQMVLNEETIKFLKNELRKSNNKCYKCGNTEHFANNCCYISINDYRQIFINDGLDSLNREIQHLMNKNKKIKEIYDLFQSKNKLLSDVLKCDINNIDKYSENIKEYYKKYCQCTNDVLIIQYRECIFEYNESYTRFDKELISSYDNRQCLSPEQKKIFYNMECEKANKSIDTINLDIIIRQMETIMKLKHDLIKRVY